MESYVLRYVCLPSFYARHVSIWVQGFKVLLYTIKNNQFTFAYRTIKCLKESKSTAENHLYVYNNIYTIRVRFKSWPHHTFVECIEIELRLKFDSKNILFHIISSIWKVLDGKFWQSSSTCKNSSSRGTMISSMCGYLFFISTKSILFNQLKYASSPVL